MENFNSEAEKLEQIEKILNDFRAELDKFEVPCDETEAVPKMLQLLVDEYFDEEDDEFGEFMEGFNDMVGDLFGENADLSKMFGGMFGGAENEEESTVSGENSEIKEETEVRDDENEVASSENEDESADIPSFGNLFGNLNLKDFNASNLFNMMVDSGLYEGMLGGNEAEDENGDVSEQGAPAAEDGDPDVLKATNFDKDSFASGTFDSSEKTGGSGDSEDNTEDDDSFDFLPHPPFLTMSDGSDLFDVLSSAIVFGGAEEIDPFEEDAPERFTELFEKLAELSEDEIEKDPELSEEDGTPLWNDSVAKFFENKLSPLAWDILSEMMLVCAMTEEGDAEAEIKLGQLEKKAAESFSDWKDMYLSVLFGLLFATDIQSPDNDMFVLEEIKDQILEILERRLNKDE